MTARFSKLMEPAHIGSVATRNRIVKTGASMCYWHSDDVHMSGKAKAYYGALARGGVGLLIIESPVIDWPHGTRWRERYRIDDDRYIEGLGELAEAIHAHGCPTFVQMWHDGPWQNPLFGPPALYEGPPIGASAVNLDAPGDFHRDVPRALSIGEIEALIDKFASAAARVQKAGFDGVDLNAASSHLLHNFLSPFWNRREDTYGGSVENRARMATTIVAEIKRRCGAEFPVSVLINGFEMGRMMGIDDDRCLTHQQALETAKLLEKAGADALQVRNHWLGFHVGGFFPDYLFYPEPAIPTSQFPKEYNPDGHGAGANVRLAAALKKTVKIPIIIVGKLDPKLGERYLREGKADFIAMTRRLQADPELPNKVAAGRTGDIAPCTACGTCLDQSITMERRCRIDAAMGTTEYALEKATTRKKVVVVGAGPSGMEAARVAAERGHEVTLYDKARKLGGLMSLAALIKGPEPEYLPDMIGYYKRQLKALGVRTELATKADSESIKALKPDAVVVATGGKLTAPKVAADVPKRGGPKVVTSPELHRQVKPFLYLFGSRILGWLTHVWLPMGKRVVIIGGGFHGCEIAEFLAKRGRTVTILEESGVIGKGVLDFRLGLLLEWFARRSVTVFANASDIIKTTKGVSFTAADGTRKTIEADTVIPTAPVDPDQSLATAFQGAVPEVYAIGDCNEAGMIVDAVAAGWRVGRQI
jgi:2,4-dienoyl-CoA reductase (NADPH2)